MTEAKQIQIVKYEPAGRTIRAFLNSEAFVRAIMGPLGSGKSTACVIEILRRAKQQTPAPDGTRRTRWAIIRNSYPELRTTTLKTWTEWCPAAFGKLTMDSPITHLIKTGDLEIEVLFLALDREEDVRKLLSLELTGAWVNEAREVPKAIIDALTGRVGRYPSRLQGGATWSGILLDTNPPDSESWFYKMSEEETPKGWEFFKQPPGDGPDAENTSNLPKDYYERIKSGKDEDWIAVYVRGAFGFITEGRAVYPMFRDRAHVAKEALAPVLDFSLLIGADFGLTPAAIIGQKLPDGRWLILDEFLTENCGVIRFAEALASYVARYYPNHRVEAGWGDPAGNQRAHSDERTALEIMKHYTGWRWRPAPSNDITMRREVVMAALNRMVDGNPGLLLSPKAAVLRKGFAGGYHFKFIRSGNGTQTLETPAKNQYSHPHDALQYLFLGGGEHDVVLNRVKNREKTRSKIAEGVEYDYFGENRNRDKVFK
jgi:hypothetical protein